MPGGGVNNSYGLVAPKSWSRRRLWRTYLFVFVLDAVSYSNPTYWSASYLEPPRSTIGIAAVQTAIEYEYRFTEYRFAEYEYDEI